MHMEAHLASYAAISTASRGRRFPEISSPSRTEFQRDRDRIIHSTAFRRLEYKTQVFVNHEGDLFRTRLTHSIEVAQIGRTIARLLHLNEDLVEAVALARDLGHTPFGHAGQDALNACVRELLEERYAEFEGLNLTFEAREGILKHCSLANAEKLGAVGERFLNKQQPSLEAQIANLADEIAYNNHDVDDGLRSGLITLEQLSEVQIFARHLAEVRAKYPTLQGRRVVTETVRRIINTLILALVDTTRRNVENSGVQTLAEVRTAPPLAAFSPALLDAHRELKRFLLRHLYRHYKVARMSAKAGRIISDLYTAFTGDARLLPPEHQMRESLEGARAVADYIAGMTDRD